MSGRGSAGTLRRLAPRSAVYRPRARRSKPQPLCSILVKGDWLAGIGPAPERKPMLSADPTQALRIPRDQARQVCLGLLDLGYSAELVEAWR